MPIKDLLITTSPGQYSFRRKLFINDFNTRFGIQITSPEELSFNSRIALHYCYQRVDLDKNSTSYRELIPTLDGSFSGLTLDYGPFTVRFQVSAHSPVGFQTVIFTGFNLNK